MSTEKNVRWRGPGRGRVKPRRWMTRDWSFFTLRVKGLLLHLTCKIRFGITCVTTSTGGKEFPVWDDVEWVGDLVVKKKKQKDTLAGPQPHLAAMESVVLGKCHSLVAHCAATAYDDGDPRQPGWFTLKTMGSAWVIEVKDPDTCARLVVVQQTVDDALTLASLLLDSEEAPWEPDPWLTAAKSKKKK
jgi:hypothetical protein